MLLKLHTKSRISATARWLDPRPPRPAYTMASPTMASALKGIVLLDPASPAPPRRIFRQQQLDEAGALLTCSHKPTPASRGEASSGRLTCSHWGHPPSSQGQRVPAQATGLAHRSSGPTRQPRANRGLIESLEHRPVQARRRQEERKPRCQRRQVLHPRQVASQAFSRPLTQHPSDHKLDRRGRPSQLALGQPRGNSQIGTAYVTTQMGLGSQAAAQPTGRGPLGSAGPLKQAEV
ncbi:hypothetical protein PAPYR_12210 [Paratrimastix pyriformis]|uniref:Uncharacterized protein n=1 Tax=Paratrimastix pyriformis TaxID=342808 RepID=A0ABQ8U4U2_9EUKA|nr:hypothetical protein PAPYR_12210 [Paratrimastix pyriformis]